MKYKKQAIKIFEDFSIFYGFLNFWTHLKIEHETKNNKNKSKAKSLKKKHAKTEANDTNQSKHVKMHEQMSLNIGRINA